MDLNSSRKVTDEAITESSDTLKIAETFETLDVNTDNTLSNDRSESALEEDAKETENILNISDTWNINSDSVNQVDDYWSTTADTQQKLSNKSSCGEDFGLITLVSENTDGGVLMKPITESVISSVNQATTYDSTTSDFEPPENATTAAEQVPEMPLVLYHETIITYFPVGRNCADTADASGENADGAEIGSIRYDHTHRFTDREDDHRPTTAQANSLSTGRKFTLVDGTKSPHKYQSNVTHSMDETSKADNSVDIKTIYSSSSSMQSSSTYLSSPSGNYPLARDDYQEVSGEANAKTKEKFGDTYETQLRTGVSRPVHSVGMRNTSDHRLEKGKYSVDQTETMNAHPLNLRVYPAIRETDTSNFTGFKSIEHVEMKINEQPRTIRILKTPMQWTLRQSTSTSLPPKIWMNQPSVRDELTFTQMTMDQSIVKTENGDTVKADSLDESEISLSDRTSSSLSRRMGNEDNGQKRWSGTFPMFDGEVMSEYGGSLPMIDDPNITADHVTNTSRFVASPPNYNSIKFIDSDPMWPADSWQDDENLSTRSIEQTLTTSRITVTPKKRNKTKQERDRSDDEIEDFKYLSDESSCDEDLAKRAQQRRYKQQNKERHRQRYRGFDSPIGWIGTPQRAEPDSFSISTDEEVDYKDADVPYGQELYGRMRDRYKQERDQASRETNRLEPQNEDEKLPEESSPVNRAIIPMTRPIDAVVTATIDDRTKERDSLKTDPDNEQNAADSSDYTHFKNNLYNFKQDNRDHHEKGPIILDSVGEIDKVNELSNPPFTWQLVNEDALSSFTTELPRQVNETDERKDKHSNDDYKTSELHLEQLEEQFDRKNLNSREENVLFQEDILLQMSNKDKLLGKLSEGVTQQNEDEQLYTTGPNPSHKALASNNQSLTSDTDSVTSDDKVKQIQNSGFHEAPDEEKLKKINDTEATAMKEMSNKETKIFEEKKHVEQVTENGELNFKLKNTTISIENENNQATLNLSSEIAVDVYQQIEEQKRCDDKQDTEDKTNIENQMKLTLESKDDMEVTEIDIPDDRQKSQEEIQEKVEVEQQLDNDGETTMKKKSKNKKKKGKKTNQMPSEDVTLTQEDKEKRDSRVNRDSSDTQITNIEQNKQMLQVETEQDISYKESQSNDKTLSSEKEKYNRKDKEIHLSPFSLEDGQFNTVAEVKDEIVSSEKNSDLCEKDIATIENTGKIDNGNEIYNVTSILQLKNEELSSRFTTESLQQVSETDETKDMHLKDNNYKPLELNLEKSEGQFEIKHHNNREENIIFQEDILLQMSNKGKLRGKLREGVTRKHEDEQLYTTGPNHKAPASNNQSLTADTASVTSEGTVQQIENSGFHEATDEENLKKINEMEATAMKEKSNKETKKCEEKYYVEQVTENGELNLKLNNTSTSIENETNQDILNLSSEIAVDVYQQNEEHKRCDDKQDKDTKNKNETQMRLSKSEEQSAKKNKSKKKKKGKKTNHMPSEDITLTQEDKEKIDSTVNHDSSDTQITNIEQNKEMLQVETEQDIYYNESQSKGKTLSSEKEKYIGKDEEIHLSPFSLENGQFNTGAKVKDEIVSSKRNSESCEKAIVTLDNVSQIDKGNEIQNVPSIWQLKNEDEPISFTTESLQQVNETDEIKDMHLKDDYKTSELHLEQLEEQFDRKDLDNQEENVLFQEDRLLEMSNKENLHRKLSKGITQQHEDEQLDTTGSNPSHNPQTSNNQSFTADTDSVTSDDKVEQIKNSGFHEATDEEKLKTKNDKEAIAMKEKSNKETKKFERKEHLEQVTENGKMKFKHESIPRENETNQDTLNLSSEIAADVYQQTEEHKRCDDKQDTDDKNKIKTQMTPTLKSKDDKNTTENDNTADQQKRQEEIQETKVEQSNSEGQPAKKNKSKSKKKKGKKTNHMPSEDITLTQEDKEKTDSTGNCDSSDTQITNIEQSKEMLQLEIEQDISYKESQSNDKTLSSEKEKYNGKDKEIHLSPFSLENGQFNTGAKVKEEIVSSKRNSESCENVIVTLDNVSQIDKGNEIQNVPSIWQLKNEDEPISFTTESLQQMNETDEIKDTHLKDDYKTSELHLEQLGEQFDRKHLSSQEGNIIFQEDILFEMSKNEKLHGNLSEGVTQQHEDEQLYTIGSNAIINDSETTAKTEMYNKEMKKFEKKEHFEQVTENGELNFKLKNTSISIENETNQATLNLSSEIDVDVYQQNEEHNRCNNKQDTEDKNKIETQMTSTLESKDDIETTENDIPDDQQKRQEAVQEKMKVERSNIEGQTTKIRKSKSKKKREKQINEKTNEDVTLTQKDKEKTNTTENRLSCDKQNTIFDKDQDKEILQLETEQEISYVEIQSKDKMLSYEKEEYNRKDEDIHRNPFSLENGQFNTGAKVEGEIISSDRNSDANKNTPDNIETTTEIFQSKDEHEIHGNASQSKSETSNEKVKHGIKDDISFSMENAQLNLNLEVKHDIYLSESDVSDSTQNILEETRKRDNFDFEVKQIISENERQSKEKTDTGSTEQKTCVKEERNDNKAMTIETSLVLDEKDKIINENDILEKTNDTKGEENEILILKNTGASQNDNDETTETGTLQQRQTELGEESKDQGKASKKKKNKNDKRNSNIKKSAETVKPTSPTDKKHEIESSANDNTYTSQKRLEENDRTMQLATIKTEFKNYGEAETRRVEIFDGMESTEKDIPDVSQKRLETTDITTELVPIKTEQQFLAEENINTSDLQQHTDDRKLRDDYEKETDGKDNRNIKMAVDTEIDTENKILNSHKIAQCETNDSIKTHLHQQIELSFERKTTGKLSQEETKDNRKDNENNGCKDSTETTELTFNPNQNPELQLSEKDISDMSQKGLETTATTMKLAPVNNEQEYFADENISISKISKKKKKQKSKDEEISELVTTENSEMKLVSAENETKSSAINFETINANIQNTVILHQKENEISEDEITTSKNEKKHNQEENEVKNIALENQEHILNLEDQIAIHANEMADSHKNTSNSTLTMAYNVVQKDDTEIPNEEIHTWDKTSEKKKKNRKKKNNARDAILLSSNNTVSIKPTTDILQKHTEEKKPDNDRDKETDGKDTNDIQMEVENEIEATEDKIAKAHKKAQGEINADIKTDQHEQKELDDERKSGGKTSQKVRKTERKDKENTGFKYSTYTTKPTLTPNQNHELELSEKDIPDVPQKVLETPDMTMELAPIKTEQEYFAEENINIDEISDDKQEQNSKDQETRNLIATENLEMKFAVAEKETTPTAIDFETTCDDLQSTATLHPEEKNESNEDETTAHRNERKHDHEEKGIKNILLAMKNQEYNLSLEEVKFEENETTGSPWNTSHDTLTITDNVLQNDDIEIPNEEIHTEAKISEKKKKNRKKKSNARDAILLSSSNTVSITSTTDIFQQQAEDKKPEDNHENETGGKVHSSTQMAVENDIKTVQTEILDDKKVSDEIKDEIKTDLHEQLELSEKSKGKENTSKKKKKQDRKDKENGVFKYSTGTTQLTLTPNQNHELEQTERDVPKMSQKRFEATDTTMELTPIKTEQEYFAEKIISTDKISDDKQEQNRKDEETNNTMITENSGMKLDFAGKGTKSNAITYETTCDEIQSTAILHQKEKNESSEDETTTNRNEKRYDQEEKEIGNIPMAMENQEFTLKLKEQVDIKANETVDSLRNESHESTTITDNVLQKDDLATVEEGSQTESKISSKTKKNRKKNVNTRDTVLSSSNATCMTSTAEMYTFTQHEENKKHNETKQETDDKVNNDTQMAVEIDTETTENEILDDDKKVQDETEVKMKTSQHEETNPDKEIESKGKATKKKNKKDTKNKVNGDLNYSKETEKLTSTLDQKHTIKVTENITDNTSYKGEETHDIHLSSSSSTNLVLPTEVKNFQSNTDRNKVRHKEKHNNQSVFKGNETPLISFETNDDYSNEASGITKELSKLKYNASDKTQNLNKKSYTETENKDIKPGRHDEMQYDFKITSKININHWNAEEICAVETAQKETDSQYTDNLHPLAELSSQAKQSSETETTQADMTVHSSNSKTDRNVSDAECLFKSKANTKRHKSTTKEIRDPIGQLKQRKNTTKTALHNSQKEEAAQTELKFELLNESTRSSTRCNRCLTLMLLLLLLAFMIAFLFLSNSLISPDLHYPDDSPPV